MDNAAQISYKWHSIKDLPQNYTSLSMEELEAIASIWQEHKGRLKDSTDLQRFNTRLQRQWAIETGIIENLYTLDRGITQLLIERGIKSDLIPHGATDKPIQHVVNLMHDQQNVVEGLFDFVARNRQLSTSYIKEIHQALTVHQDYVDAVNGTGKSLQVPLKRGEYKTMPNNPTRPDKSIHEYCPPEHVASEMDRLIAMHLKHLSRGVSPEVEAAWLHHRFTQIHPFQDGNGRVARALATLIFLRAGWFPLVVISENHRGNYIDALERADQGDLEELVTLFGRIEKQAFIRALSISDNVLAERETEESVMESIRERFQLRQKHLKEERGKAVEIAEVLLDKTVSRMEQVKEGLTNKLRTVVPDLLVFVNRSEDDNRHWFWNQVVEIAGNLDYYANLREYHGWVRLKISEERQAEIVVSIHAVGPQNTGVLGGSAFIEYRSQSDDSQTKIDGPHQLSDDLFQFSYKQREDRVLSLFEKWLNNVLLKGLDEWRRQL